MERIIKNFEALACPELVEGAENELRRGALEIAEAGYAAVNVGNALGRTLRIENDGLHIGDRVYRLAGRRVSFVGIGKCAFVAAEAVEKLFGDMLTGGIAVDVSPIERNFAKIETFVGTHPLPSEVNERATKRVLEFLSDCRTDDLIIMLISGGGSTLLCSYESPMTSADESLLFKELTARGVTIQEMNTVRKHTSRVRGGGLVRAAYPAEVISLIVSDVPGNDIEFISSGPTVKDTSTINDAKEVLARYGITPTANVVFIETPKEEKYFERVANILFLTSRDALSAMKDEASRLGYTAEIVDEQFAGEARDIARAVIEKLHSSASKTALLYAGESTVTISEHSGVGGPTSPKTPSRGGRNQEMALAALETIGSDELILPFASDGHDNTDAAGAIGDNVSRANANAHGLSVGEFLNAHSSNEFFSVTGDALMTGYTGSNVSDLIVAIKN